MFDVFLHIYREDYICSNDDTSESKMIHEICKRITKLRIDYKEKNSNRLIVDTIDEIYGKFLRIFTGALEDATI